MSEDNIYPLRAEYAQSPGQQHELRLESDSPIVVMCTQLHDLGLISDAVIEFMQEAEAEAGEHGLDGVALDEVHERLRQRNSDLVNAYNNFYMELPANGSDPVPTPEASDPFSNKAHAQRVVWAIRRRRADPNDTSPFSDLRMTDLFSGRNAVKGQAQRADADFMVFQLARYASKLDPDDPENYRKLRRKLPDSKGHAAEETFNTVAWVLAFGAEHDGLTEITDEPAPTPTEVDELLISIRGLARQGEALGILGIHKHELEITAAQLPKALQTLFATEPEARVKVEVSTGQQEEELFGNPAHLVDRHRSMPERITFSLAQEDEALDFYIASYGIRLPELRQLPLIDPISKSLRTKADEAELDSNAELVAFDQAQAGEASHVNLRQYVRSVVELREQYHLSGDDAVTSEECRELTALIISLTVQEQEND